MTIDHVFGKKKRTSCNSNSPLLATTPALLGFNANIFTWLALSLHSIEVCVLTIHVQPLHDDGQLHFAGHVTQGAHGHTQLLLGDEPIPVAIQNTERLTDLCAKKTSNRLLHNTGCLYCDRSMVYFFILWVFKNLPDANMFY